MKKSPSILRRPLFLAGLLFLAAGRLLSAQEPSLHDYDHHHTMMMMEAPTNAAAETAATNTVTEPADDAAEPEETPAATGGIGKFFSKLFTSSGFMPHGHCYFWKPEIVWLHVISDSLITLAYYCIPIVLVYIIRKRKDLAFSWMFALFGVFICACGTTHLMEIWTLWHPTYRLSGMVKAITAVASVGTAILLVRLVPMILALPSPAQLAAKNEALRESEERFRSAFEDAAIGMALTSPEGKWVRVNRSLCRLLGYSETELLARSFQDITHSDDLKKDLALVQQMLRREITTYQMEKRYFHRDGRAVWVLLNVSLVWKNAQEPQYFIAQIEDISARKEAELALVRMTSDLRRSNADLEQFAYVASHDLQEPLRAVAGCAQILQKRYQGNLDAGANELIGHTVDGANRMQQLISDLLAFSRVGTHGHKITSVNMNGVVDAALANLSVAVAESGAAVTRDELPTLSQDAGELAQLFQNLLGNALKYRSPVRVPVIHIGARKEDGGWHFTVRDNGIGIDPKYSEKIFLMFQRLHSRDEYPGTGIGLALCKKIVERHGGKIWVESVPGEGSTFHFTLHETHSA